MCVYTLPAFCSWNIWNSLNIEADEVVEVAGYKYRKNLNSSGEMNWSLTVSTECNRSDSWRLNNERSWSESQNIVGQYKLKLKLKVLRERNWKTNSEVLTEVQEMLAAAVNGIWKVNSMNRPQRYWRAGTERKNYHLKKKTRMLLKYQSSNLNPHTGSLPQPCYTTHVAPLIGR